MKEFLADFLGISTQKWEETPPEKWTWRHYVAAALRYSRLPLVIIAFTCFVAYLYLKYVK